MKDCLVTKLNGAVNNDSLDKLGVICIDIDAKDSNYVFRVASSTQNECPFKLRSKANGSVIQEGYIGYDPSNFGDFVNINNGNVDSYIEIYNKYDIVTFNLDVIPHPNIEMSDLEYLTKITKFILSNADGADKITANIEDFAKFDLVQIDIRKQNLITGNLEALCLDYIQKGKNTDLSFSFGNSGVRLHNKTITAGSVDYTTTPGSLAITQGANTLATWDSVSGWQYFGEYQ